ncbi:MAG: bifunctional 2-C-methyl-D-erythritol 4-phosphate cytidylyltransferase/2-C-methyl-D-erythritol 2,4-cyclodiphosphate synthase [Pseudomonadota bacterium]
MIVDSILVAAGQGERFGGAGPKQLQRIGGRPMWRWSHLAFTAAPSVRRCLVIVPAEWSDEFSSIDAKNIVVGGATRTASVKAGLAALSAAPVPPEAVLIHDAARPGLTQAVISRVTDALSTHSAAAPALPVVDALKRRASTGELVQTLETVSREGLHRVQTPQGFHWKTIMAALGATGSSTSLVDDLAAVETLGAQVKLVEGDPRNDKITFHDDLARLEMLMGLKDQATGPAIRMGKGFDVHAFEPGQHVTLCGVDVPHTARLKGHSDADVAWHALTDAILGALALGDIGDHFPPSDPQWKGAPSNTFLSAAAEMATKQGYAIANLDITIICEAPKVKPHRSAMREATATLLGLKASQVSVKATTTEGLGFTGRGEGIAAEAIVVLARA